jgi:HAD superfamily hydrolase (TIGR01509 family)
LRLHPQFSGIQAVIFDLDGTLIDSITPFYGLVAEIFRGIGLSPPSQEKINEILGNGLSIMESLVPQFLDNRADLIQKGRKIGYRLWENFQQEKLKPFPATKEILESLKKRGVLRGLATSGEASYVRDLVERDFLPPLEAVVTKEEVTRMKPAPDIILECIRKLDCSVKNSVYVGDSPIDIQAGKAAGVKTIAVLSGTGNYKSLTAENPDKIIPDISHLLDALGEIS